MMEPGQSGAARPRLSPGADRLVRWAAVLLTFTGALLLVAGVGAGIALPFVAIGASLVAIEQVDKHRGH